MSKYEEDRIASGEAVEEARQYAKNVKSAFGAGEGSAEYLGAMDKLRSAERLQREVLREREEAAAKKRVVAISQKPRGRHSRRDHQLSHSGGVLRVLPRDLWESHVVPYLGKSVYPRVQAELTRAVYPLFRYLDLPDREADYFHDKMLAPLFMQMRGWGDEEFSERALETVEDDIYYLAELVREAQDEKGLVWLHILGDGFGDLGFRPDFFITPEELLEFLHELLYAIRGRVDTQRGDLKNIFTGKRQDVIWDMLRGKRWRRTEPGTRLKRIES